MSQSETKDHISKCLSVSIYIARSYLELVFILLNFFVYTYNEQIFKVGYDNQHVIQLCLSKVGIYNYCLVNEILELACVIGRVVRIF